MHGKPSDDTPEWTEKDLNLIPAVLPATEVARLRGDLKHAIDACEANRAAHDEVRAALDRVMIERDVLALENQDAVRERSAVHHKLIAAYNERDDMRAIRNQLAEVLDDVAGNLGVEVQALIEDPSLACRCEDDIRRTTVHRCAQCRELTAYGILCVRCADAAARLGELVEAASRFAPIIAMCCYDSAAERAWLAVDLDGGRD